MARAASAPAGSRSPLHAPPAKEAATLPSSSFSGALPESPPILVVLAWLLGVWQSLLRGAWLAVRGLVLALKDPEVRRVHRQILLPLAAIAIPAYALLVLPAHLLLRALRFSTLASALAAYSKAAARLVPLGVNLALRFIFYAPLDRAYLAVLSDVDPELARQLSQSAARSHREVLWKEARRLVRLVSFLPLYLGLSLIPVFGRVLKWGFKVYTLSNVLPSRTATAGVALLSLLPLVDTPTTLLLQAYLAQLAYLQELQLPYLGRVMRGASRREETAFLLGADPLAALAFAYSLSLLLSVPYAGPLLCIAAHAAAPLALVELLLAGVDGAGGGKEGKGQEPAVGATAVVGDKKEVAGRTVGKSKVG